MRMYGLRRHFSRAYFFFTTAVLPPSLGASTSMPITVRAPCAPLTYFPHLTFRSPWPESGGRTAYLEARMNHPGESDEFEVDHSPFFPSPFSPDSQKLRVV
jgi:hypothetical protein